MTNCLSCDGENREDSTQDPPCVCLLGWKDTGVPDCTICADGFYKLEDLCPACGSRCATCEIENSNCTNCKGSGIGRGTIFADPSCGC